MENYFYYYFAITLAKQELNLHKIMLKTNKKSVLEFVGKGKDDYLLEQVYEMELDEIYNAKIFECVISMEVKEFMIYLESNHGIIYTSKIINSEKDLKIDNENLRYFNFNLMFYSNRNENEFRNPPRTKTLDICYSFHLLKTYFFVRNINLKELCNFSLKYIRNNLEFLIEVLNTIKEQKMHEILLKLLDIIDMKYILFDLKRKQELLTELKRLLGNEEINKMLIETSKTRDENYEAKRKKMINKFHILKVILENDEKESISILNFLNFD